MDRPYKYDDIRSTYRQNIEKMASVNVGDLPDTENPHVKAGLRMQLRFCRRWAIEQMRHQYRNIGLP
jgi:hypothetical protein